VRGTLHLPRRPPLENPGEVVKKEKGGKYVARGAPILPAKKLEK